MKIGLHSKNTGNGNIKTGFFFIFPEPVKEAAIKAIRDGDTHYTHSLGLLALREEICHHYYRHYRVSISPDQVIVTSGTSPAMLLVFSTILNEGDEVILSNPSYACYPNFVKYAGGVPVYINVNETDGFRYRVEQIKARLTPRTKAILVNSPANPTGTLLPSTDLAEISTLGLYVVSDEVYHGLVYEGHAHSMLEFTDRTFVINGFSKVYAMTGWRLGYVIVPRELVRPMQKLQQNLFICAGSFIQKAGLVALQQCETFVQQMVATYNQRRRFLIKRLREIGLGVATEPTGAFYVLANAKKFSGDSYRLAFDILEQAKVAVTPGIDFGTNAEGYLRFSYANSLENIATGMDRLAAFFAAR